MVAPIGRRPVSPAVVASSASARAWAQGFNFGSASAVRRLEVPRAQASSTGPESVQRAWALYKSWEDNDLGSVRLLKANVGGQNVYALHTTTDGDGGFLELYSEQGALLSTGTTGFDSAGKRTLTWDASPGAVRERVAPKDVSPSVQAFFSAIEDAKKSGSSSGATVTAKELKGATNALVGTELALKSVDGFENAALFRVLADPATKLNSGSRAYAAQLAALYTDSDANALGAPTRKAVGTRSAWAKKAEVVTVAVGASGAPPRANAMTRLAVDAWKVRPSQLVPLTKTEAQKLLRDSGATAAEAKAAVDALADAKGSLFGGVLVADGPDWIPRATGVGLFGVSADGRTLKGLNAPTTQPAPSGAVAKDVIKRLLGVERDVEVVNRRQTPQGEQLDLRWRPPGGGLIEAELTVPTSGEATLANLTVPPAIDVGTAQGLAGRLQTALGTPREVWGSVGVRSATVGFVAAHRATSGGPLSLSTIHIATGGAPATVTSKALGTSASDLQLARDLAVQLARVHAQKMVEDPAVPPAAKLEVALRTLWATSADLVVPDPQDSSVGFDPAKERAQFMLPSVWGDNAVFVTFARNGTVRVEDFN